jgi:hypothetical protein
MMPLHKIRPFYYYIYTEVNEVVFEVIFASSSLLHLLLFKQRKRRIILHSAILEIHFGKEYDYKALHHKFNTTEPPPNGQYLHGKPPSILQTAQDTKPKQDFQCYFDSTQLNLIARHANEVHLFSADVSEEDMRKLFSCQVSKQLKARSNRRVAFFFDMLCSKNLICKQWQSVIAKHKLILSSSTDKPLTTTKLSSATSDAKGTNASIYEAIRKNVQEIADCGKNDSKDTI